MESIVQELDMATLLYISVSPRGNYSISKRLGDAAVSSWKAKNPEGRIIERDLATTPLTFVDLDWIQGAFSPPEYHTEGHRKALALSDQLVAELLEADEIILATPMYNFAIPLRRSGVQLRSGCSADLAIRSFRSSWC